MIKLYTDGASKGNPGPASAGAWAEDEHGNKIFEQTTYLGVLTNNEAEYSAMIIGLQALATTEKNQPLRIYTDSQLMARQLRGEYKMKSTGLKPYYEQVKRLLSQWPDVQITDIARQHNAHADHLANLAFK